MCLSQSPRIAAQLNIASKVCPIPHYLEIIALWDILSLEFLMMSDKVYCQRVSYSSSRECDVYVADSQGAAMAHDR